VRSFFKKAPRFFKKARSFLKKSAPDDNQHKEKALNHVLMTEKLAENPVDSFFFSTFARQKQKITC
jgi:ferritin